MPFLKIEKITHLEIEYTIYIMLLKIGFSYMENVMASGHYSMYGHRCKTLCMWRFEMFVLTHTGVYVVFGLYILPCFAFGGSR
jgi:hypothetical protein